MPAAEDIGWLPGQFPQSMNEAADRTATIIQRLIRGLSLFRTRRPESRGTGRCRLAENARWGKKSVPVEFASYGKFSCPNNTAKAESPSGEQQTADHAHRPTPRCRAPRLRFRGEESFAVYNLFTEKYGYSSKTARSHRGTSQFRLEALANRPLRIRQRLKPAAKASPKPVSPKDEGSLN